MAQLDAKKALPKLDAAIQWLRIVEFACSIAIMGIFLSFSVNLPKGFTTSKRLVVVWALVCSQICQRDKDTTNVNRPSSLHYTQFFSGCRSCGFVGRRCYSYGYAVQQIRSSQHRYLSLSQSYLAMPDYQGNALSYTHSRVSRQEIRPWCSVENRPVTPMEQSINTTIVVREDDK